MKRRSHRRIQCARAISSRNLTGDGTFAYAYDAENRLVSATSAAETNGAIRVLNAYDHRNRRIRKTVQRLRSTIALPPSPPVGIHEWETQETHTFVWDANNIVLEKVVFANGTTRTLEYFWGADKSGTEQGAGGVGGLLYLTVDGAIYIPCYDNNGNITRYLDSSGNTVAQYTYDAFGNTISQSGPLAGFFRHRFSTKYYDSETGLYYYGYRFYHPILMRWLNRDPLEEDGGVNLYLFCNNLCTLTIDTDGRWTWTEATALDELRNKIREMRSNGYDFAADALEHYIGNHSSNIDLSRYANQIYNDSGWQQSFVYSIIAELRKKDPKGTNKKVEIGDIEHKESFSGSLQTVRLGKTESDSPRR